MSSSTSSSSAVPSTAVIPLPTGYTLVQYLALQGQLVTIAITVSVAFAIVAWDYFSLLPDEIALYRTKDKRLWRTPTTWLFILLRYSGLLATLPSLFFSAVQSQHCQIAVVASQVGAVLVVASSGIIFCYRVFAIWSNNRLVQCLASSMFLIMMSCWIAVATQYTAITGAASPFGSNCQMQPIVSWAPISYASSVAFDSVILGLTLAKLHPNITLTKSAVGRQIFRDTLMYFILTAVTNITVLSIQSLGSSHTMLKPTAVPFSTLMTVTMGSRVYLNLKLLEHRRQREQMGIPLTMPLSSQDSSMRFAKASNIRSPFDSPFPSPGLLTTQVSPYTSPSPYVTAFPTGRSYYEVDGGAPPTPPKENF